MDIVIVAEKPTIAEVLSQHLRCPVHADDITVRPNPAETGSFLIRWRLNHYLLSPDGRLALRAIRVDGCQPKTENQCLRQSSKPAAEKSSSKLRTCLHFATAITAKLTASV